MQLASSTEIFKFNQLPIKTKQRPSGILSLSLSRLYDDLLYFTCVVFTVLIFINFVGLLYVSVIVVLPSVVIISLNTPHMLPLRIWSI